MTAFRPKEVLEQAQAAEKKGDKRHASAHYTLLSTYLQKKGKWKEAKVLLDRAIRLAPRSARLYVQRALCEIKLGKAVEARAAIDLFAHYAAEKKRTEEYAPYMEEHLADYPELCRSYYEGILKLDRTRAFPFIGLAKCHLRKNEFSEAKKMLLDALSTQDRRDEIMENLAVAVGSDLHAGEQLKRFSAGEVSRDELVLLLDEKVEPKKEPVKRVSLTSQLDSDDSQKLDLRTLIENLEEELGVDLKERHDEVTPLVQEFRARTEKLLKNDARGRLDLALAFFEMDLLKDARDELSRIGCEDSLYVDGQCLLGEILCAEGGWLAALDVYQECLRSPEIEKEKRKHCLYKLVEIYMRLGDWEKADAQLRLLEKNDPNYRNLRFYKKEIATKERLRKAS